VDALKYGYKVWVVSDAVKSIQAEQEAFDDLKKRGISFLTTKEVKKRYSSSKYKLLYEGCRRKACI